MIIEKDGYIFVDGNVLKKVDKLNYDDSVCMGFERNSIKEFSSVTSCLKISTDFDSFYYFNNDSVLYKDLFIPAVSSIRSEDLSVGDSLVLPYKHEKDLNNTLNIKNHLYLNTYDYSFAQPDILTKYGLPPEFLKLALTTGCPDEEFYKATEYNRKLDKLLIDMGLTDVKQLSDIILKEYSNKIPVSKITINETFLDLVYLCISNNYSLLSHTSLKLYIYDEKMFKRIITFLHKYNIKKLIHNDVYNLDNRTTILINSSFLFNLFKSNFDYFDIILHLDPSKTAYLNSLLSEDNYVFSSPKSRYVVREFLYRSERLYSMDSLGTQLFLNSVKNYIRVPEGILIDIKSVENISGINLPLINII